MGTGYFSVSTSATAQVTGENATDVTVTLITDNSNKLQIVYSHFETGSNLVHDPTLGISSTTTGNNNVDNNNNNNNDYNNDNNDDDNDDDNTTLYIILGVVGGVAIVAVIGVVVIGGLVYAKRKKSNYDSL